MNFIKFANLGRLHLHIYLRNFHLVEAAIQSFSEKKSISRPKVFLEIAVLKKFWGLPEKHIWPNPFVVKLQALKNAVLIKK